MRNLNTKSKINSSRFATEPTRQPSRKMTQQGYCCNKVDNLGVFHDQLMLRQKFILSSQRRTKNILNSAYDRQKVKINSIKKKLMNATNQIKQLRKGLQDKKIQVNEQRHQKKLNQFIDLLKMSINDKNVTKMVNSQRSQAQPIFYPVPMPYPTFNYSNERYPSSQRQNRQMQYSRLRSKQRERNDIRLKKIKKKFHKVFNVILFTIYLKNYCKRIRQARKIRFNQLFPFLQPTLNLISFQIRKLLKPFFTLLFAKREVTYDIQENQNNTVLKSKLDAIRKLIIMIIQIVRQWMQSSRLNKKVIKTFYYLCRHGNYTCTVPILTPDQLQMSCISAKFGYISANYNLQNAAFMNLIYIKIVIYNILLSPQTIFNQFQDGNFNHNLYVIASVLYQLTIDLQDQYMLLVPKSYKIGDSKQVKGLVTARPLLYKNSLKIEGELISGLKQQGWTKKYFFFQSWNTQKQMMKQTVNTFHFYMANYHKNVSKKYY